MSVAETVPLWSPWLVNNWNSKVFRCFDTAENQMKN